MPRDKENPIVQTWTRGERARHERKTWYDEETHEVVVEADLLELRFDASKLEGDDMYSRIDLALDLLRPDLAEQVGWALSDD